MRIIFLGLDKDWIESAKVLGYDTFHGKVQDYIPKQDSKNIYYISPCNSLGFMDRGIDLVYSKIMFKGIESTIKEKIKKLNFKTKLGRPYIPIGKAIATQTDIYSPNGRLYLITSPTMLIPQDISNTPNAYICMIAVIKLLKDYKHFINDEDELIIPSLCCGYGSMKPELSISQIIKALETKNIEKMNIDYKKIIYLQPNYYENSEWKNIPPDQIIKS